MSGGLLQRMADGGPVSIRAKGLAAHGCATLPFDLHRQFGAAWLVAVGHIPQVAVGRSAPDGELLTVADLHGEEVFFKFHAETIHRLVYIFKRGLVNSPSSYQMKDHWLMIQAAEREVAQRKAADAERRRPIICSGSSMNHGYVTTTNTVCR